MSAPSPDDGPPGLKRTIGLSVLSLYGLGTIIGAGIYVLVGKVAAEAGMAAPAAFALAALVAALTGLSYAELSSRLPKSAGEATYVEAAFGRPSLTRVVGLAVVLTGLVSGAAICTGVVGYARLFVDWPPALLVTIVVLGLGAVTAWGVELSVGVAALITLLELAGLVLVLIAAGGSLSDLPARAHELWPRDGAQWSGVGSGALLAFYAFIGFEDMVNMAEEVKDAPRTLPRAILIALVVSSALYMLVALAAVLSLPTDALATSEAPLADIVATRSQVGRGAIGAISMLAVINGAMVQVVMASRVLYGMGRSGALPAALGRVHPRRRTPLLATGLVTALTLLFALALPLVTLARFTSVLVLLIFALVNVALLRIRRAPGPPPAVRYPAWVPVLGFLTCLCMLLVQLL